MDKYRKVTKPKEEKTQDEAEIRVTAVGSVSAYISRAAKVFNELEKSTIMICATGNALTKAVTTAEVIKRRFKGLHQTTAIESQEIVDEYEPIEEGLDKVTQTKQLAVLKITLSKDPLNSSDKGYQAPLDDAEVKEVDAEELMKPRGRGEGRGRGRGASKGKGKGKGKGKSVDKGKGEGKGKGKGKGKDEPPVSKGKGKGKGKAAEEPKGKGKGKGKEALAKSKGKGGKGKDEPPKGKGKGKDKGKGKGKGKDWDWGFDPYAASPPLRKGKGDKGKGKGKDKGKGKGKDKGKKGKGWQGW